MTTTPAHIVVTGAAGKAGRAAVADLLEHGYRVLATDLTPPPDGIDTAYLRADLTDHGQVVDVLDGADAVRTWPTSRPRGCVLPRARSPRTPR